MHIKNFFIKSLAALCLIFAFGCSDSKIATQPQTYQINAQKVTFAPPPSEIWHKQESPSQNKEGEQVVRYTAIKDPEQFISVTSVNLGSMTSWSEDPNATAELTRKFQNQILKRSESEILKQKEVKLDGEIALQLTYTYLEGTNKVWGQQLYAFHNKLLWNIACSSSQTNKSEAEEAFKHVVKTFKFD
ncbi:MAG: PsbP-related protein [Candidatus Bruticola sp.]